MEKAPHIILIGAGLIGLSCADALIANGARVTIIEKNSYPGQGAGFRNSGMIHPSQARAWNLFGLGKITNDQIAKDVFDLAKTSAELIHQRAARLDKPLKLARNGSLQIFETESTYRHALSQYDRLGVTYKALVPNKASFNRHAITFPNDSAGSAYLYSERLAASIIRRGSTILYDIKAFDFLLNDNRLMGIRANDHDIMSDHVIITAGFRSPDLLSSLGVNIPMIELPGFALNFNRPKNMLAIPIGPIMDHASHSAMTRFHNHIRLSGSVDTKSALDLQEIWHRIAPDMVAVLGKPVSQWRGVRPMSLLGRPFIGRSHIPGLWVNTGHGHMGWTLSAGSGALMAQMILGGQTDERFALPRRQ